MGKDSRLVNRLLLGGGQLLTWSILLAPIGGLGGLAWVYGWGLGGLFLASPWLLDQLLAKNYGVQASETPLALPTPYRPRLRILPAPLPLVFSYGWEPRNLRLCLSTAALEQLPPAELSPLVRRELGDLWWRGMGLLSLVMVLTQAPYGLYLQLGNRGNQLPPSGVRQVIKVLATLSYGAYRLGRRLGLTLARLSAARADQLVPPSQTAALTQAYSRLCSAIPWQLLSLGQTPGYLEGLDLLLPLAPGECLTCPRLSTLTWTANNPYRTWLSLNQAQPSLGMRLNCPRTIAQPVYRRLARHTAPYLGTLAGLGLGWLLTRFGGNNLQFLWLYNNWQIILALGLGGFSIGTLTRFNACFPELNKPAVHQNLPTLLESSSLLPTPGQPVWFQGRLLGRRGSANGIGQDLFLATDSGVVRLHITSGIGVLGLLGTDRWSTLIGQPVEVTGWFRRGMTPWIDAEVVKGTHYTHTSCYQLWTLLQSCLALLGTLYLIIRA